MKDENSIFSVTKNLVLKYRAIVLGMILGIIVAHIDFSPLLSYFWDAPHDFRKTKWGMSIEEVKATESKKLLEEESISPYETFLFYWDELEGLKALVSYHFIDNKLAAAEYDIVIIKENSDYVIVDFNNLKEKLTYIYGEPKEYKYGKDDSYLSMGATWETNSTLVKLASSKLIANTTPSLEISYESKKLKSMIDKYKDERDISFPLSPYKLMNPEFFK